MTKKRHTTLLAALGLVFAASVFAASVFAAPAQAGCNGTTCWGAVVTNPNGTAYGYRYNRPGGRGAINGARANCPGNCRVYVSFKNGCGAIAVGRNGVFGWVRYKSRRWAKYYAVRNCSKYGFGCTLRVRACTRYSRR